MHGSTTARPYGLWDSPLTPATMALSLRLGDVQWDSDGQTLVWLEGRSDRGVLVAQGLDADAPRDLTQTHNVRAMVGYGGGDFTVAHGHVYYAEKESGRLYRLALAHGEPQPVSPPFGAAAAPAVSPDGRWLVYVHTDHRVDMLALVDTEGEFWPQKLATGADFYMQPVWHPDGRRLAWIEWDHPHMPWDSTRLLLGTLHIDASRLPTLARQTVLVAEDGVAVSEPRFTPDGRYLLYISDADGWNRLYRYDLHSGEHRPLTPSPAEREASPGEVGRPAWQQGVRTYTISADGRRILYTYNQEGFIRLWSVTIDGDTARPLSTPLDRYTDLMQPVLSPHHDRLAAVVAAPAIPARVVSLELNSSAPERVHARSTAERIPADAFSRPEAIRWTAANGDTVYGLFYPPRNPAFHSPGKPPLIVLVHGGPTSQATATYNAQVQFFTTRGFGVLAVNYRGSTGYGKAYLQKLYGNWGVYDVEDTVRGAQYLVETGRADPERLVVMGGSAGGFTVLLCLIRHPGFFRAGLCLYGVSNLFTLATDTHKFEERYLDSLVGPLPAAAPLYRERSPVFHAAQIRDPLAVFQGEEDRVVPRDQADTIVESLRRRGVPHEYHLYAGEGHGWRKAETIERFYTAVMRFLQRYVLLS
ncbi:MAG: S9 family peptidase [Nitrospinota bacterium]|nr:MAG: S9 family peptidase [Nitrospinota bacterium]